MAIEAKEIIRLFHMEDELMLTRAETMHGNLVSDLADFTARYPWMDAPFAANFLLQINSGKAFPLDDVIVSNLKVLTGDVNAAVEQGMRALDVLDNYAKFAYPTDLRRQRIFGQDNWAAARNDQEKMVNALEHAHGYANAAPYKLALIGKGMAQADIDLLSSTAVDIDAKNKLQEKAKSDRPVTTQDRIAAYNTVWNTQRLIAQAALLVYRDDAAKLDQYRLYPGSGENTIANIHVTEPVTGNPRVGAQVTLTNTSLASQATDGSGIAPFESINMPDFVDVEVVFGGNTVTLASQPVLQGDVVTIEVEI